jgi:ATP-dependent RNA helicase RhlE
MMHFSELKLIEPLLRAVQQEGYSTPTPIQQQAIPHILAARDVLGCAQTGTGKTAAFALPILQRLLETPRQGKHIRVLVLAPTRELATQIGESFTTYGKHTPIKQVTIFGGVGQNPQVEALRRGPEVLVAAPGRLLDLMGQGFVRLDRIDILVLDEADRMLDMGFINDVRKIIKTLPRERQTLLFSATMPDEILDLAHSILHQPVSVEVTPVASTVEKIRQAVFFVDKKNKPALLRHILEDETIRRVLVFTRTKHGANKVVEQLGRYGTEAQAIHGNKSQSAREKALAGFKRGTLRVLVATDIAARGIDVDDVTHVINYDLPNEPETYVHRIGRTARAGASGVAYSFCDAEERAYLRQIEKLIRLQVPLIKEHPYLPGTPIEAPPAPAPAPRQAMQPTYQNGNGRSAQHNNNGTSQPNPAKRRRRRRPQGARPVAKPV